MAEVTGFTADRMRVIENTTVVDGEVQGDNLILLTREGTPIDAGNVRGPQGDRGPIGEVAEAPADGKLYVRRNGAWVWHKVPLDYPAITNPKKDDRVTIQRYDGTETSVEIFKYNVPAFASTAERDAQWPAPQHGARCLTAGFEQFYDVRKWVDVASICEIVDGPLVMSGMSFDANNFSRTTYIGTRSRGMLHMVGWGNPIWVSGSGPLTWYIPAPYSCDLPWGIVVGQMLYKVAGDPGGTTLLHGAGMEGNNGIEFKVYTTNQPQAFSPNNVTSATGTWPYGGGGWSVFMNATIPVVRSFS